MKNKICSLRKSIYDLAIKGQLVSQNETETPFELPQSKSKDDCLIVLRDGKYFEQLKKGEKEISEVPFELPKGWKYARFKSLFELYTGDSIPQSVKEAKYLKLDKSTSTPYIGTKDVGFDHVIDYENGVRIPNNELTDFRIAAKDSILFCIEGGSAGKKIGITDRDVCFGNKLMCFKPKYCEIPLVYYFLQSPTFTSLFNDSTTGIITGISKKNLENLLVPLPPISEQFRIVNKLKLIEPLLDEYEELERERESISM